MHYIQYLHTHHCSVSQWYNILYIVFLTLPLSLSSLTLPLLTSLLIFIDIFYIFIYVQSLQKMPFLCAKFYHFVSLIILQFVFSLAVLLVYWLSMEQPCSNEIYFFSVLDALFRQIHCNTLFVVTIVAPCQLAILQLVFSDHLLYSCMNLRSGQIKK